MDAHAIVAPFKEQYYWGPFPPPGPLPATYFNSGGRSLDDGLDAQSGARSQIQNQGLDFYKDVAVQALVLFKLGFHVFELFFQLLHFFMLMIVLEN